MRSLTRRSLTRRSFTLAALAASLTLLTAPAAHAQAFPGKPVHLVVPQAPGGASDALARVVAQKLSDKWGQPVVVENKVGAGGNIGMEQVARAPGDGHTLLMSYVGTHAINGALYKDLRFNIEKDFVPVATLATLPFVAVTTDKVPAKTFAELVALANKQPVFYGSAGNGSVNHLLGEMVNRRAGTKMQHVPYKGAGPALQDLMGGQVQVVFTSLPSVAGLIRNGQVKPLALTSAKRVAGFPDIPTIAESGYAGFDVNPWFGIMAPSSTPPAVVQRINADVREVLTSKDVVDKFEAQGAEPLVTTPEQFSTIVKADITKWSEVVRASGARVD
jgi:tripartite-type tricarboxylate transporter receptor subunit TctC